MSFFLSHRPAARLEASPDAPGPQFNDKDGNIWTPTPPRNGQTSAQSVVTQIQGTKNHTKNLTVQQTYDLFFSSDIKDIIIRCTNRDVPAL